MRAQAPSVNKWIEILKPQDPWNVRHFLALLAVVGVPSSFLDVGCGTGIMVQAADGLGIDAKGIDKIPLGGHLYKEHDLRQPYTLERNYQLVTCLEVAEHIPDSGRVTFLDSMVQHVDERGILVFSSAGPGQAGDGHINLRPAFEWRSWIDNRGLHYREDMTLRLALVWNNIQSPLMWLPANVQIFTGEKFQ